MGLSSTGSSAGNPAAFLSCYTSEALLAPCNLEIGEETEISDSEDVRVSGLILMGNV